MKPVQRIAILGATGSIGRSTLDVIARHPDRFCVAALTAHRQVNELFDLCQVHRPAIACMANPGSARQLRDKVRRAGLRTIVLEGEDGLVEAAASADIDVVMAAIVGAAGLRATLAAANAGKKLLLANKEALVMAGSVFMETVERRGATLLPIDSEHNAIFQCLPPFTMGEFDARGIRRILLTGSGGPFRTRLRSELHRVTPAEAIAHPNWAMGPKISVDSATMMNKGLEIIEAHWLFGARPDQIKVVIHPQSVIHSMVEYADGSVIAQLGNPDMRTPIAQALAFPDRIEAGVLSLDLMKIGTLNFEEPDPERFPALRLSYDALEEGGTAPAILNAANEVAVGAFLEGKLPFLSLTAVIEETLQSVSSGPMHSLGDVLEADLRARRHAQRIVIGLRTSAA